MIIGITGGSGCGKTTLLRVIRDRGGLVLDCDEIYHQLLQTDSNLLNGIEARFPGTVENGVLQRKKLGAIVFADRKALLDLNAITHAAVKREVLRRLEDHTGLAGIDAIGLFEGGLAELCDVTVAVTAPEEARIQRLMLRDGIDAAYARSRIAAQPSQEEFARRCDVVLSNDAEPDAFTAKCVAFLDSLSIMKEKT